MNDDRRPEQRPRVNKRPDSAAATRRQASPGAEPTRTAKSAGGSKQQRQVARTYSGQQDRKVAQRLYSDDAYYKKDAPSKQKSQRPQAAKSMKSIKRKRRKALVRSLWYSVIAIIVALLIGFLLKTFVFEVIKVSSDAMYQCLLEDDWVLVTKFDYWTTAPERGDIVAVSVKGEETGTVLRRIVGMPGESISIDGNGDTLINGDPLGESYVRLKSYEEYKEVILPRGRYFVLSDNRTVKLDSRSPSIDVVSKQNISGRVRTILWPLSRRGNL